jgi:CBS domain containing-hemolysin-like protein
MPVSVSLVWVVVLLIANGFFVAAEFALVKARGSRLSLLADGGHGSARLAVRIQNNLEAYLAACQLGITMASLGLGWVGEPAVAALLEPLFHIMGLPQELLHTVSFIVGFLLFSSLHIIVGEQLPKTWAIRRAESTVLKLALPLHLCYLAVWPLNWLLNSVTGWLLRKMGVEEASHGDILSSEEIRGLVKSASDHGTIIPAKANMMSNLFEFYQQQVDVVMIPRSAVTVVDLSLSHEANLEQIMQSRHSRFPVVDSKQGDRILGLLLVKDLQHALMSGHKDPLSQLERVMRKPLIVPESQSVPTVFEMMRAERAHLAMVVDEYGEFSGIVTLEDLIEEIVGEIQDEKDLDVPLLIQEINEFEWQLDGLTPLKELEKMFAPALIFESQSNTLSGFLMEAMERIPRVNDTLTIDQYTFEVTEALDRRVGSVRLTYHPDHEGRFYESSDLTAG